MPALTMTLVIAALVGCSSPAHSPNNVDPRPASVETHRPAQNAEGRPAPEGVSLSRVEREIFCSISPDGSGFVGGTKVREALTGRDVARIVALLDVGALRPCWQGMMHALGEIIGDDELPLLMGFLAEQDVERVKASGIGGAVLERGFFALNALQRVARRHPRSKRLRAFASRAVYPSFWLEDQARFGLVSQVDQLSEHMTPADYVLVATRNAVYVLAALERDDALWRLLEALANDEELPAATRRVVAGYLKQRR